MATITVNRKVFDKLLGKKLSDKEIHEKVPLLAVGVESITKEEMVLEVEPNRPDYLSTQGFARGLSAFLGLQKGLRKYQVKKSNYKVIIDKSLKNIRPYTVCAVVKNLKFDDEKIKDIIQIQEKLHSTYGRNRKKAAIGVYPLEHIEMPITFTAKDPNKIKFLPLEYPREITGKQILSKHPAGREYGQLLEGLKKYPFFFDKNNNVLSMPPIINSHNTGKITQKTTEVFIECSGFDYLTLSKLLNILVCSLADMGGEIYNVELEYPDKKIRSPQLAPETMKLDKEYVNKVIGIELNEKTLKDCLSRMGYDYKPGKVSIPAYRTDILHQIDLVEDIAIAYGYNNLEPEVPAVSTIGQGSKIEEFRDKITNILTGLELIETHSFCISNKDHQTKLMNNKIELVELANALSQEHNCLRGWMIPSLMEILRDNKHHEYPQNIFEMGYIFKKNTKFDTNVEENVRLGVLLCNKDVNYTKIRQVLDYLMSMLDLDYKVEDTDHKSFIQGRAGRVVVGGKKVAYIGEISPQVITNWGVEVPVAALEINITELFKLIKRNP